MAKRQLLLLVNEEEANVARAKLGEAIGVNPLGLLQAKYTNPTKHPGKAFFVCCQPGPPAGFDELRERAAELLSGEYLILDVEDLSPSKELADRGYEPVEDMGQWFPMSHMQKQRRKP